MWRQMDTLLKHILMTTFSSFQPLKYINILAAFCGSITWRALIRKLQCLHFNHVANIFYWQKQTGFFQTCNFHNHVGCLTQIDKNKIQLCCPASVFFIPLCSFIPKGDDHVLDEMNEKMNRWRNSSFLTTDEWCHLADVTNDSSPFEMLLLHLNFM